ncbi:MAG: tetratricopeptide repeat protein [Armatimonadetes bacterium]|nr:tetratricopeptide repeat protein [Armatimonadota bacterium]
MCHRSRFSFVLISMILFAILTGVIICYAEIAKPESAGSYAPSGSKTAPKTDLTAALRLLHPGDTRAHLEANIRTIEDAISKYGTKDPWACKAFYLLGLSRYRLGRHEEALADFDSCLQIPEPYEGLHFYAQNMRTLTLKALGRNEEAIAAGKSVSKFPGKEPSRDKIISNSMLLAADMQLSQGQNEEAVKTYRQYLSIAAQKKSKDWDTMAPDVLRGLACRLVELGKTEEAIKIYDRYLKQFPNDPAVALMAMKRLKLVRTGKSAARLSTKDMEQLVNSYPTNTGPSLYVLYDLAAAYEQNGRIADAAEVQHRILDFKPTSPRSEYPMLLAADAGLKLTSNLKRLGKEREQRKVLEEIVRRFPDTDYGKKGKEALELINGKIMRRRMILYTSVTIPVAAVGLIFYLAAIRRTRHAGLQRR